MPLLRVEVRYSSVVSQRARPHALRAQRERGGDLASGADAARAEHRHVGADGVDDLRHEHHRRDLSGVAAGLVALGDDDVDAVGDVARRASPYRPAPPPGGLRVRLVDDVVRR